VVIRKAKKSDCEAIIGLRNELAVYLNEPKNYAWISAKDLERDGYDMTPPLFHCIVADEENGSPSPTVIGYAMYIIGYPIWEGREVSVREICVTEARRRNGVGELLLKELAKITLEGNFSRMSIDCPESLLASQLFLKHHGIDMTRAEGWSVLKFSKEDFHKLAQLQL